MSVRYYFDAKSGAFFDRKVHGEQIPKGAKPLTIGRYRALIDGRAAGQRIVCDKKGNPGLQDVPPPSAEELRAALTGRIKREAGRRIEAVAPIWRQLNDLSVLAGVLQPESGEQTEAAQRRAAIEAIRARSNQIEAALDDLDAEQLAAFQPRDDAHWAASAVSEGE